MPWHILLMARQMCIELAMCCAIERHTLELAVFVTLIGVKKSG
jgi:hypothetical protein